MRIGIIGSSSGGAFAQACRILRAVDHDAHRFCVITDRPCGLETVSKAAGLVHFRIDERDNRRFSHTAKDVLDRFGGVDFVLLFFTRLVTRELYCHYATFNIHPSLLPAFKGLHPIEEMLAARVRFFGTTLHLVNDATDGGPIVAQTVMPLAPDATLPQVNKFAYIHKVYLSLLLVELLQSGMLQVSRDHNDITFPRNPSYTAWSNPSLQNPGYQAAVTALQRAENLEVMV